MDNSNLTEEKTAPFLKQHTASPTARRRGKKGPLPASRALCLTRDGLLMARTALCPGPEARRGLPLFLANFFCDCRAIWRDIASGKRKMAGPVTLAMVLVAAFLIRGLFFSSYSFSDDFHYASILDRIMLGKQDYAAVARWVGSRTDDLGYLHGLRFGLLYPLILLRTLFGAHPNLFAGYHLFLSLVQIMAVYLLMRHFFNEEIGLASALLLTLMPMDIVYATYILPDSVIPPYMTISLLLFVYGQESRGAWKKLLLYSLAGMVFGLAWYSRVYAAFILVVMAALLLYRKRVDLWTAAFPIGFAVIFFLVNAPIHKAAGSWFLDLKAASSAERNFRRLFPIRTPWQYTTFFARELLEGNNFLPFSLLAIAGAGAAAGIESRWRYFPLLWLAGLFFIPEAGTARLPGWTPFHKLPRFMTMFTAPIAALGGVLIGRLSSKRSLFFTALFILGAIVLISLRFEIPVWGMRP